MQGESTTALILNVHQQLLQGYKICYFTPSLRTPLFHSNTLNLLTSWTNQYLPSVSAAIHKGSLCDLMNIQI